MIGLLVVFWVFVFVEIVEFWVIFVFVVVFGGLFVEFEKNFSYYVWDKISLSNWLIKVI